MFCIKDDNGSYGGREAIKVDTLSIFPIMFSIILHQFLNCQGNSFYPDGVTRNVRNKRLMWLFQQTQSLTH